MFATKYFYNNMLLLKPSISFLLIFLNKHNYKLRRISLKFYTETLYTLRVVQKKKITKTE